MKTMKKIFYFLSALALFACDKAEDFGQPVQGGVASGELPEVIYATVADNNDKSDKTRTVVAKDGNSILWNAGDNITYFFDFFHGAQYKYNGEDGVAKAEFDKITQGTSGFELSRSYAVYPFEVSASCIQDNGVEKLQVFYPAEQNYMPNSFGRGANVMVAAGEHALDDNLRFRNACGYLIIKLYGENITVKSITLTALGGEKIAGKGLITASHGADPVVAMTDQGRSTIMLNCGSGVTLGADAANATEFWFAMPPTTFEEGFKILVAPTTGMAFEMQTSKKVEITRNEIQPMAALQYTPNAPAPNQIIYTRSDESTEILTFEKQPLHQSITKHYAHNGKFIIECADAIEHINENGFERLPMKTIILPSQLKSIGKFAFYATDLVEIVIPGSVTVLHKDGFHNCDKLKRVTFLWGEEDLQINDLDGVFMTSNMSDDLQLHESDMDYMYLDRNIRYADKDGVVSSTNKLKYGLAPNVDEVIIGPNVSKIPPMAFNGADATRLVIPGNINYIGAYALRNLYELKELVIEPSPTNTPLTIDHDEEAYGNNGPFYLINSLYDVLETIQLNREIIYDYQPTDEDEGVFSDRRSLKTVVLGEQVKTISDYMFSDAPMLKSVTTPSALTSIGNYAFYNCPALTSVTFPTSLTSIGNSAFENCDGLTSVTISEAITTIGESAFKNCDGLTSATLSSSAFGANMFDDCDYLATVTIGGSLDAINADAFSGCSKLSTLNISGSVTTIGDGAFDGFNLTSLNISGHVGTIGANAFDDNDKMTSFTVTGSVGTIGKSAFEDSDALTTVSITGIVDEVCSYAFSDCDRVTTLAIHANKVGERAYEDMDGLTSATLYGATVGNGVFYDCNALQTVVIDGGVNSIGDDAFYNCGQLSSVTFNESANKLIIGYQPSITDDVGPFYQSPLATINLYREIEPTATYKEKLKAWDMGIFTNKHYDDDDLTTTVTLGSNVKTIWPWMFSCVRMQNVTIPASVTSIGKEAFSYCYILTEVTCEGTTAPTLGEDAFYDSDKLEHIYVPSGSLSDYQSKWSKYKNMLHEK